MVTHASAFLPASRSFCPNHLSSAHGRRRHRRSRRSPSTHRIFKKNVSISFGTVQLCASVPPPDNYNDDAPPFSEKESPRDRARRMSMARELQNIYYKAPPSPPLTPQSSSFIQQPTTQTNRLNDNNSLVYGSTVLRHLPTLTTNDGLEGATESSSILPGYQFVWNIHNPQHCHMFHSILSGSAPWYFAHVHIPSVASTTTSASASTSVAPNDQEGRGKTSIIDSMESYNNIQNRLKLNDTPLYGTLLRITDRRFQDDDGRIVLAVQAIDRVIIHNVASMPGTFLSTDVQLAPERELMDEFFDKAIMSSASYISSCGEDASEIIDDEERGGSGSRSALVSGAARAAATAHAYRVRRFEYLPIFLEEKPTRPSYGNSSSSASKESQSPVEDGKQSETTLDGGGPEYISVVQLANYDAFEFSSMENTDSVTAQALKTYWDRLAGENSRSPPPSTEEYSDLLFGDHESSASSTSFFLPELDLSSSSTSLSSSGSSSSVEAVAAVEIRVWCSLDTMIRLLSLAAAGAVVPVPTQLLGLLPIHNNWPSDFALEEYANSLSTSRSSVIGTAFKSPFVRVDQIVASAPSSSTITYSPLRRAQRLSNAIWLILDGLAMTGADPPPPPRDKILAMNIEERLFAALQTLDGINDILRKIIPKNQ